MLKQLLQNKNILVIYLLLISCLVLAIINWNENRKIKYVDTISLFSDFQLTKDLEAKEKPILNEYKNKLDSLHKVFDLVKEQKTKQDLGLVIYQFENDYRHYLETSNKNINDIVWARLNKMIDEYGSKNKYSLMFGANGMGTILYGDPSKDITKNVLEFCNKSYKNEN